MYQNTEKHILEVLLKLSSLDSNFKDIFFTPAGYTLLKALDIEYSQSEFSNDNLSFLDVLGLFDGDCKLNPTTKHVLPFKTINSQDDSEADHINNEFIELIEKFGSFPPFLIDLISRIIGEILNNVCHHSGKPDNLIDSSGVIISSNYHSGQFFLKKSYIQIALVDTGIGILSSVRRKDKSIQTAEEAISKALEYGFSGGTTLEGKDTRFTGRYNGGIGLSQSLDIIKKIGGDFFIGSKDAMYCYSGKGDVEKIINIPLWKGTFVVFNIYTDSITEDNYEIGADLEDERLSGIDFGL